MSETDLPLSRLRAQLAGPRGYRRIDALLAQDDARGAIAALAPVEVYELIHEVGFEDAAPLIEYVTPEQIQGCLDLDIWQRDEMDVSLAQPWLAALIEAGFEKVTEVWAGLDVELRALILAREIKVYDVSLGEEPADDNEHSIMATPDRFFMLELPDEENAQRLVQRLVEDLYRGDMPLAQHTIMAARSELQSDLEEMAYRWRSGRLADSGYVDFYEALGLFAKLEPDAVTIGEGSQDPLNDSVNRLAIAIAEEVVGKTFLARTLAAIDSQTEAERLESALTLLVNKVLAAGRAKPGESEVLKRGALYATATLSLGLETIARGDVARGKQALESIAVSRLFRVGYTVSLKLARLAQALAPRSLTAGSPAREVVQALCSPRPLFASAADQPPKPGMRPFESQADLRRAGELLTALTLRIALVESLGVDVVAMGQLPEPRPELDDHLRTALARVAGGGELTGNALSVAELRALVFDKGKLSPAAREHALDAVRRRLGAAQLTASGPLLGRIVDGLLDEVEGILGNVPAGEAIDPRFVEGILVEVNRS